LLQLAKAHNDNQEFSRNLSNNELVQMMHATFIKEGGVDKSFSIKQKALMEVGIVVDKSSDKTAKRYDNQWQLACHSGELWALLSQVFKLTLEGKLKGMDATAKKFVERDSVTEEAGAGGGAGGGGKSKKGRLPKTARHPMPRSRIMEDIKERKVVVPDIKEDAWKKFIGVEVCEGGTQYYTELLTRVVNLQLSLKEAGEAAVDFKRLAKAQADMVQLLANDNVTNWLQAEKAYPKHCLRERLDPILRAYQNFKPPKGGDASSKVPKAMRDLVDEAQKWMAGSTRNETAVEKVWEKSAICGEYQYILNDDETCKAFFKVVCEDMEKIAVTKDVAKMPYRFVMFDVWYDLPEAWGVNNPEGMTAEVFGKVLDGMMSINTSRLITIVVFLSHTQKVSFFQELKARCNAGVELAYWYKVQGNAQPGDRLTNCVEEMLIGYHNNEPALPNTKRVNEFFNFKKVNPDNDNEVPRQMNVFEFEKVTKLFHASSGDKSVVNVDQKPLALLQHVYSTFNGKAGDTVLDLGCGSASASHAAILMGMHAMALDNNPVQVRG
jgi:hypothetical protein